MKTDVNMYEQSKQKSMNRNACAPLLYCALVLLCLLVLCSCYQTGQASQTEPAQHTDLEETSASSAEGELASSKATQAETESQTNAQAALEETAREAEAAQAEAEAAALEAAWAALDITEDYRESFIHGEKGPEYQRYIVLHDTEGTGRAADVVQWWDSNGNLVAAHFVVNKDGSIVQCVALDNIAHHAGFGDTGHNELYGTLDESRDDKRGTTPIGEWAQDYGMNSYSVGIEMVHVQGEEYPEEQLQAVDNLIAYIDAYYGFESTIIDHKDWRTGNSDTSPEFAGYLENYKDHRTHN